METIEKWDIETVEYGNRRSVRIEDYVGNIYHDWTVIGRLVKSLSKTRPRIYWLCRCKCGTYQPVLNYALLNGRSKRCIRCSNDRPTGPDKSAEWLKLQPKLSKGTRDISGSYLSKLRKRSFIRNMPFTVSPTYLQELLEKQGHRCVYTGLPIRLRNSRKYDDKPENVASLDRICSRQGYEEGNVQWVTSIVNKMKLDMSEDRFLELCERITNYRKQL